MEKKLIAIIVGTRPDILKTAPVLWELQRRGEIGFELINVGQHYDENMSLNFFKELRLPQPIAEFDFSEKFTSEAQRLGLMIERASNYLRYAGLSPIVVTGDSDSALAAALAANKLGQKVVHIEAGCRSFDKTQPEEVNRTLIDHISELNFAPTRNCWHNLCNEHLASTIRVTGHPIVDLVYEVQRWHQPSDEVIWPMPTRDFIFVTIHRRENILKKVRLQSIFSSLFKLSEKYQVMLPLHPHTEKMCKQFGISLPASDSDSDSFLCFKPAPYYRTLKYIVGAEAVITDSGGIQQEAAILATPCITVRKHTEWIETVQSGVNSLVDPDGPIDFIELVEEKSRTRPRPWPSDLFGKPGASKRIVDKLLQ